jgi:predicted PurR-regulated permease PerM
LKEKQHENSEMVRLWTRVTVRVIVVLVGLLVGSWLLYQIRTVLLLLVLSIFFCYLIAPIVHLIEQPVYIGRYEIKMPRSIAIIAVYLLIAAGFFAILQLVWPPLSQQVTELVKNLPNYSKSAQASVTKVFNDANSWMKHVKVPQQWQDAIFTRASDMASSVAEWLAALVAGSFGYVQYLTWFVLLPVLSFFLLKDASSFEQNLLALLPNERMQKRAHWLLMDISGTLAAYIRAQITACLVIGAVMMIGLTLIQAPYPVVLGAIAGLLEFIPLVGPLLAAVIIFGLTLTMSFKTALVVALFIALLRILQDYVIYPRIVGRGIKMHPIMVILAILAGAEIGGLIGIFLSIPAVGLIMVFYNHYLAYRGIQNLHVVVSEDQGDSAEEAELAVAVIESRDLDKSGR